jgi:hypothetical protein
MPQSKSLNRFEPERNKSEIAPLERLGDIGNRQAPPGDVGVKSMVAKPGKRGRKIERLVGEKSRGSSPRWGNKSLEQKRSALSPIPRLIRLPLRSAVVLMSESCRGVWFCAG